MNSIKNKLDSLFLLIFKIPKNENKTHYDHKSIKKWDSLSHLNLILAIEGKFGIEIKPEESIKLISYKEILEYLEKKVK